MINAQLSSENMSNELDVETSMVLDNEPINKSSDSELVFKDNSYSVQAKDDCLLPSEGPQTTAVLLRGVRFRITLGETLLLRYKKVSYEYYGKM